MFKRIFCILALFCAAAAPCGALEISADSAILIDADTGYVFYEKNADERRLIASTTKIMTALAALGELDPDAPVRVPEDAARVEGSRMGLAAGEIVSVRALLYGLMLLSGNDAALTLASALGGEAVLCAKMNALAEKLGLENTHYANAHGLDDEENYSTARDLSVLAAYALKNPAFAGICAQESVTVDGRAMKNHNKLLSLYAGAVGVKTGYTKAAGRCLVSAVKRDGRLLVLVTLHAPDDWDDHASLYDEAFGTLSPHTLAKAGDAAAEIPLADGKGSVKAVFSQDLELSLFEGEAERLAWRHELPRFYYAAPEKGAVIGKAFVLSGGRVLAETPLVCG